LARPGEFSERAFLNDKLDLAQAEAIADLIESSSEQAARSALQSLQGAFSRVVSGLIDELIQLRVYVEAAIDFPDEDVDFLGDGKVAADLQALLDSLDRTVQEAHQGTLLRDGMQVVIAGRPNAGKSSLLNALSGQDTAIVTEIEGTTRDVLREQIQIDGMPLHIIDTAGLRDSTDAVERIGIDRAWAEIEKADRLLLLVDSTTTPDTDPASLTTGLPRQLPQELPVTVLRNKVDLSGEPPGYTEDAGTPVIRLSAQSGEGVTVLREHLKDCMGYQTAAEGRYMARRRHLDALERARAMVVQGQTQLSEFGAGELLAEDLRQAQEALGEITGAMTPDELLGEIFSSFCIGK
ncbi:MAG: tRNA uridine-5-carboxymethylaminomethyl(34) synthesis GTPase MnmE, partial [Pseudomonadota bacterium]